MRCFIQREFLSDVRLASADEPSPKPQLPRAHPTLMSTGNGQNRFPLEVLDAQFQDVIDLPPPPPSATQSALVAVGRALPADDDFDPGDGRGIRAVLRAQCRTFLRRRQSVWTDAGAACSTRICCCWVFRFRFRCWLSFWRMSSATFSPANITASKSAIRISFRFRRCSGRLGPCCGFARPSPRAERFSILASPGPSPDFWSRCR